MNSGPSEGTLTQSLEGALGWVEQHLSAFDPFVDERSFSAVFAQRVGELAVAVYCHYSLLPDQAARMAPLIELLDSIRRKPEFSHRVLRFPTEFVLNAEVYGILRLLGRDDLDHRALVQRSIDAGLLDQLERYPHRELDVRLALDWAALDHEWPPMREIAHKSPLLRRKPSALFLDEGATYALTHLVMFVTDFGVRRELGARYPELSSASLLLDQLIGVACLERHWDLLGELLFCVEALRLPRSAICEQGWQTFLGLQRGDGSFPGPHRTLLAGLLAEELTDDERREVDVAHHYHTTLVAWFTIANRLADASCQLPLISSGPAKLRGTQRASAPERDDPVAQVVHAVTSARDWLLGRAHEQLVADTWEEGVICSLIIGLHICDELAAPPRSSETLRRLGLALGDDARRNRDCARASVKARFFVTAILDRMGVDSVPYLDLMLGAARVFRGEDAASVPTPHGLDIEEKRAILALLGVCQPSERFDGDDVQEALAQPLLNKDRGDLNKALTLIEIVTRWGKEPLSSTVSCGVGPVLLAVSTAYLRQYDFDIGCRILRATSATGVQATELGEWVEYLFMQQRPDGCFGFFGPDLSDFRLRGPQLDSSLAEVELVTTVASLWTLGEILVPSWGFPSCLAPAQSRHE